jgi:hypothetical protein
MQQLKLFDCECNAHHSVSRIVNRIKKSIQEESVNNIVFTKQVSIKDVIKKTSRIIAEYS